jgi:hypothetical protein
LKDGVETDVDCGGNVCNACANKLQCGQGSDCASSTCANGTCVAQHCTNTYGPRQVSGDAGPVSGDPGDATETDIDCGGPDCAPCKGLQGCVVDSDCASGLCSTHFNPMSSGVCLIGDCTNHIQDYFETDIDCGSSGSTPLNPFNTVIDGACPPCATGQGCNLASDCAIGSSCVANTDPMTKAQKRNVCAPAAPAVCSLPAADAGPDFDAAPQ